MTRSMLWFLAAVLAFGFPVKGQTAPADAIKNMQALVREKKYDQALAVADEALKTPDLAPADKARLLKLAAETSQRQENGDDTRAAAYLERIVSDPNIANNAKIDALNSLANIDVHTQDGLDLVRMDLSKAHATLERALALPKLTPDEKVNALKNIGKLYERQDQYDEARQTYQKILDLDIKDNIKATAERLIADTYARQGDLEKAAGIYKEHGWETIGLYEQLNLPEQQRQACEAVLKDPKASEKDKWAAFSKLPCWNWRSKDFDAVRQACETYLPGFMEKDPNRATILLGKFRNTSPSQRAAFVEWAAGVLLQAPKLSDKDYLLVHTQLVEALAAQGKIDAAAKAASAMAHDKRIPAASQNWASGVAVVLGAKDAGGVDQAMGAVKDLPMQEKTETILGVAKAALMAGNDQAARALYDQYLKLVPPWPQASITCPFVDNAPFDVGSWLGSPLLNDKASMGHLDRPYGDNLKFLLETDSAVTGRNVQAGGKKDTGDSKTDLRVVCDADGIHFFLMGYDEHTKQVLDGVIGGGSYEMYFAPGHQQAYYLMMCQLPSGQFDPDALITMYPSQRFRMPSVEDGTLRSNTQATDKGFATQFFLSWELFYDKLPTNGTKWQFGAIRWTRSGGFSFGGSQSVNYRSNWGDVVFSGLTDEHLNAIKRRIVYKAVAKYRKVRRDANGPVSYWSDRVLGDPVFYAAKVAPLVKKLDDDAATISDKLPALTPQQVERLFKEAVPGWMDLEFQVAQLRTQYLRDKQLDLKDKPAARQ